MFSKSRTTRTTTDKEQGFEDFSIITENLDKLLIIIVSISNWLQNPKFIKQMNLKEDEVFLWKRKFQFRVLPEYRKVIFGTTKLGQQNSIYIYTGNFPEYGHEYSDEITDKAIDLLIITKVLTQITENKYKLNRILFKKIIEYLEMKREPSIMNKQKEKK